MTRALLPLAALLALAACEPAPTLPPEAVSDAYQAALLDGDIDDALGLLEAQADAGDLNALATLADVRSRGYVITPRAADQKAPANVAIWTWPWDGPLAIRRFERTLQDSVETGSHNALFFLADRSVAKRFIDGEWSTPDAERAQALYDRLASEHADPLRLAFLAQRLGDDEAYQAHLRASAATGQKTACVLQYYTNLDDGHVWTAGTMADQIDTIAACLDRAPVPQPEETLKMGHSALQSLVEQRELGNEAAAATLDSLRTLGLFERHPRLEAYVAEAG